MTKSPAEERAAAYVPGKGYVEKGVVSSGSGGAARQFLSGTHRDAAPPASACCTTLPANLKTFSGKGFVAATLFFRLCYHGFTCREETMEAMKKETMKTVEKNVELTGEELRWMYSVFKGDFRIIPRRVVQSVISKGLGIPNLGGAFNLTNAGRNVFRRTSQEQAANDGMHIVKSRYRHRSNWRQG